MSHDNSIGSAGRRLAAIVPILIAASLTAASGQELKHYDSSGKGFWQKPPPDWFLGDETTEQKGLVPPPNPALPASLDEINANLKNIKLPPGFSISVYASGMPEARQMAWGGPW
jgi:hypothetical protein